MILCVKLVNFKPVVATGAAPKAPKPVLVVAGAVPNPPKEVLVVAGVVPKFPKPGLVVAGAVPNPPKVLGADDVASEPNEKAGVPNAAVRKISETNYN